MIKTIFISAGIAILLSACAPASRTAQASGTVSGPAAIPVQTVAVAAESIPETYEATGTVQAKTTGTVSAKLMGYVREVKAQLGDRVEPGQVLAVLDTRDLDIAVKRAQAAGDEVRAAIPEADSGVASAKAAQDLAQVTFNRMQDLYNKKSISNQEFDEASARLKLAQAAYEMARAKRTQLDSKIQQAAQELSAAEVSRSYATITAPFAGQVTAKSVEPGNLAAPGAPLFTIERDGAYRLEAAVDESRLKLVRAGQSVMVRIDGLNRALGGHVSEIVPSVDAASRTGIVKIDLPSAGGLRSGMFGRAEFAFGTRKAVMLPVTGITERGQLQSVFVADGGFAHTRLVTVGERTKDRIEVLSGVSEGEQIVAPVPQSLTDGATVEVRP